MQNKTRTKRRTIFTPTVQTRLVKEYQYETKTAFLTSVVVATDLLILKDTLVDYDTLMNFADEVFAGRKYDPKTTEPAKILKIAEELFLAFESVYVYFLKM